jgi:F-type H+-transporting ATPase subunit b
MNCKSLLSLTAILHCFFWLLIPQAKAASGEAGPKLPQLDVQTYASQIFWLIVSFIVLYFLVSKVAMPRISEVLEERQERIEDDLDKAETLKKEAYLVKIEYEKALSSAREKASDATRQAQEEIAKHGAEVEALANQKVTNMLNDAESRIKKARVEVDAGGGASVDTLEQSVARDIVGDTVQKLIGVGVSSNDIDNAISNIVREQAR